MARVSNPRHKRRTLTTDAGAKVLARAVKEAVRMRVPPSQSERVAILLDPHTARVAKTLLTTDQRYAATMSTRDAFVKLDCEAGGSKPEEYAAAGPGLLLHHRPHPQTPTPTLTLTAPDCRAVAAAADAASSADADGARVAAKHDAVFSLLDTLELDSSEGEEPKIAADLSDFDPRRRLTGCTEAFRPLCHLNWAKVRTKATASEFASYNLC